MVTRERRSPSGIGCIHEQHEDGDYHPGTEHDLLFAPGKVTQMGPGFYPCNGLQHVQVDVNEHQGLSRQAVAVLCTGGRVEVVVGAGRFS